MMGNGAAPGNAMHGPRLLGAWGAPCCNGEQHDANGRARQETTNMTTTIDHRVASSRAGLSVMLRNKCGGLDAPPVLFVHGATYPSSVTFDYPLDGVSWMDVMAKAGFDAWCIDLLGYGAADRPPEMAVAADAHGPIVDTADAVADVKRAVDFILAARDRAALDLIGYSWGTAIGGQVATDCPARVRRLVLAGALWVPEGPMQVAVDGPLGAYRLVSEEATVKRWTVGLDDAQKAAIGSAASREQWARAALASDPQAARHVPPRLRAPTGVVKDVTEYWMQGRPTWDPAAVRCPTLVVVGEWDHETTPAQGRELFARLTAADTRRFVMIGGATHLMLLERQRQQLYEVVTGFL